jgi:hypothetical protein
MDNIVQYHAILGFIKRFDNGDGTLIFKIHEHLLPYLNYNFSKMNMEQVCYKIEKLLRELGKKTADSNPHMLIGMLRGLPRKLNSRKRGIRPKKVENV